MQQTTKYKLDLIEKTDAFSPDALNQNMEKVEEAIQAETAALEQRVVALEAHRFYLGHYVGNGAYRREIDIGFKPKAVLLFREQSDSHGTVVLITESWPITVPFDMASITENGLQVGAKNGNGYNVSTVNYYFLAFV